MLPVVDAILIFGLIVLACGSAGLWIVRVNAPLLRGISWLAGAFAAGGVGALLLLLGSRLVPLFGTVIADLLILLSFVLLHVAILELADSESLFPEFGAVLLAVQAMVDVYLVSTHPSGRVRVTVVGLLIAAQTGQTAMRLLSERNTEVRAPAWFTAFILFAFSLFNILRSLATGFGLISGHVVAQVEAVTFSLFVAVALGIAFGLFWITTTMRSSGLEHMASTDPLTRIYNRRVFLLWCEKELVRSERGGAGFSILMIDMDHFKMINDSFGHRTGDLALCAAAERMQDSIRGIDVLGRWGGEEFVALLPHASPEAALVVAERLRGNVEKILLRSPHTRDETTARTLRVTVSVGIASYVGLGDDLQSILQRADDSLYRAKAAGRNRVLAMPAPTEVPRTWIQETPERAAKAS